MLMSMRDPDRRSDGSDALRAAAALRHDLGKAIRFSAPGAPEASTEALRERLRDDVVRTRRGPSGQQTAVQVFDEWRRRDGARIRAGAAREVVERLERLMEGVRPLAAGLDALDRGGLLRLDELTREIADACRCLVAETSASSGGAS